MFPVPAEPQLEHRRTLTVLISRPDEDRRHELVEKNSQLLKTTGLFNVIGHTDAGDRPHRGCVTRYSMVLFASGGSEDWTTPLSKGCPAPVTSIPL